MCKIKRKIKQKEGEVQEEEERSSSHVGQLTKYKKNKKSSKLTTASKCIQNNFLKGLHQIYTRALLG